jgi:hypothetical protein
MQESKSLLSGKLALQVIEASQVGPTTAHLRMKH